MLEVKLSDKHSSLAHRGTEEMTKKVFLPLLHELFFFFSTG